MPLDSTDLYRSSLVLGDQMSSNINRGIDAAFEKPRIEKERLRIEEEANKKLALDAVAAGIVSVEEAKTLSPNDAAMLARERSGERASNAYEFGLKMDDASLEGKTLGNEALGKDLLYKDELISGATLDNEDRQFRANNREEDRKSRKELQDLQVEAAKLSIVVGQSEATASGMATLDADGNLVSIADMAPETAKAALKSNLEKVQEIQSYVYETISPELKEQAARNLVISNYSGEVDSFFHPDSDTVRSRDFEKWLKKNDLPKNASFTQIATKLAPEFLSEQVMMLQQSQTATRESQWGAALQTYGKSISKITDRFPFSALDLGLQLPEEPAENAKPGSPMDDYKAGLENAKKLKAASEAGKKAARVYVNPLDDPALMYLGGN